MSTQIDDPRVQIAVQTPNEPDAPGHALLQAIGSGDGRPSVAELATSAWFTQQEQIRGSRLATIGLGTYAAHPELELLNVPTMLLEPAVRLMKELAGYVLAGGAVRDGDVMQLRDSLPCLVGFAEASTPEGETVVRVMFLA